jgi:hypothetical protein
MAVTPPPAAPEEPSGIRVVSTEERVERAGAAADRAATTRAPARKAAAKKSPAKKAPARKSTPRSGA